MLFVCLVCVWQVTGHMISMEILSRLGLGNITSQVVDLVQKLQLLKVDVNDYLCLKFVILLNPGMNICFIFVFLP